MVSRGANSAARTQGARPGSADAAKEIKALITASVERVEAGTSLVNQAGDTMTNVAQAVRRVTAVVSEISTASTQQSARVAQVGQSVAELDQATQQNAALAKQSATVAVSLRVQGQQLVQAKSLFKVQAAPAAAATRAPWPPCGPGR